MKYDQFDYVIVEKGELLKPSEWNKEITNKMSHITKVEKGKTCVFPHVDSCLAIIIPLKSGAHVVAHIGIDDLGEENREQVFIKQRDEIIEAIGKDIPCNMICYGDFDWIKQKDSLGKSNGIFEFFTNMEELNLDDDFPVAPNTDNLSENFQASDIVINEKGIINKTKWEPAQQVSTEENEENKTPVGYKNF